MIRSMVIFLLLLAAAALLVWLFLTWYHADDEPVFGPASRERVTFKTVVRNALHDLQEITRPAWMRLWLNAPFVATMTLDAVTMLHPDLRQALFVDNWIGGGALILLTLLARYGSTPAHAPVSSR